MADFMIRFLLSNLFISFIIGILLLNKRLLRNILTSRMEYHLWFLLLGLLAVPFLPVQPMGFRQFLTWLGKLNHAASHTEMLSEGITAGEMTGSGNWMNDFALSVSRDTPSLLGNILWGLWIAGILVMTALLIKSALRLNTLKKSALPLQNEEVLRLYEGCLDEMGIKKYIPVCSTAFLKSPIVMGLFRPCICLPIHLISDYNMADMRYMLLHELQHYRHKDALVNYLMNLAGIFYWFNPLLWYALREMQNDREIACDASVLKILKEENYEDYGNTLINFAEKISLNPFPFSAGLSGSMKQMKRRILTIAVYEKPSAKKRAVGIIAFGITAVLLICLAPMLSTQAAGTQPYDWNASDKNISYTDLSPYFEGYEGSFVLYDLGKDSWRIHNMEHAALRVSPNSTYKIYDALFGLEEGVITPDHSLIPWDGEDYPFEAWNSDQTLESAMASSVNWYFQTIDKELGVVSLRKYIQRIKYGNESIGKDLSSYWMESSLEISAIEQVELLAKLHTGCLDFAPEHIAAVKDALLLSSSSKGRIYGKTGTGQINGRNVNGWFVGFTQSEGRTCLFATNIQGEQNATGSKASEISLAILSDMNIWK